MKKYLFMFAMSLMVLGFTACSSDDDEETTLSAPAHEADAVKYNITSANSEISSVEFTESGNYIITSNSIRNYASRAAGIERRIFGVKGGEGVTRARVGSTYDYYGKYTKNGDVYTLEGFGTIKVVKNGDTTVSLEFTQTGKSPYTLMATAESPSINNSSMSQKLCRTWRIAKIEADYRDKKSGQTLHESLTLEQMKEYDSDFAEEVIFTKAGTYMVKYADGTLDVALWAWLDEGAGRLCYSWDGRITDRNRTEDVINVYFSGNQLVIVEETDDEYEYEKATYYLNEVR